MKAVVVRFGGYGDLIQASSIFAALVEQGYEVTLYTGEENTAQVVKHDPNLKKIILVPPDVQVSCGDYWLDIYKNCDKFIPLNCGLEVMALAVPNTICCLWPPEVRHQYLNVNYLERQHFFAQVPHKPQVRFFPTKEESKWAEEQAAYLGGTLIGMVLTGSALNKVWWGYDTIINQILRTYEDVSIVLFGGDDAVSLAQGWDSPRVLNTCGKWPIRQSYAFAMHCGLIIGPETGLLNSVCQLSNYKIVLLSHSTKENLTRDWINTVSLSAPKNCFGCGNSLAPACHIIHRDWTFCTKDEKTGTAKCMADIHPNEVWGWAESAINRLKLGL